MYIEINKCLFIQDFESINKTNTEVKVKQINNSKLARRGVII